VGTLIVDDNNMYRQFLVDLLCQHFPVMRIAEAGDGEEVCRQVDAHRPDLVFMDIHMPGHNGLELTKTIKASHPDIVVVILTSYDLPEYQEAARENGASFFLAKGRTSPSDILNLVRSLATALPQR
jgi:DNA-binding NarL/FixJ family response regulator